MLEGLRERERERLPCQSDIILTWHCGQTKNKEENYVSPFLSTVMSGSSQTAELSLPDVWGEKGRRGRGEKERGGGGGGGER